MAEKIWCFSTPSREIAEAHPKDHFGWMRNGAELFAILESSHRLFAGDPEQMTLPVCLKHSRMRLLVLLPASRFLQGTNGPIAGNCWENAGMDVSNLSNIDTVDAALCALTAHYLAHDNSKNAAMSTPVSLLSHAAASGLICRSGEQRTKCAENQSAPFWNGADVILVYL